MKTVYMYVAAAAAIAVLVIGIVLLHQTPGTASAEKNAQYPQSGLNQNPTQNVKNNLSSNTGNDNKTNENGFGEGDDD